MATRRRRRNGLALKQNSSKDRMIARKHKMSTKRVQAIKKKDRARFDRMFKAAGGAKALTSYRKKGKATRASVKGGSYKYSTWGSKSKSKSSRGGRKVSAWAKFTKKHAGKGWSMAKMADEYRKAGKKANPRRRRNGLALKRNGLALKQNRSTRRRGGLNSWQRFVKKHAGKGYSMAKMADMARKQGVIGNPSKKRKNPSRKRRNPTRRRRNTSNLGAIRLRNNPMSTGIGVIDSVAKGVGSIPVVGKPLAPYIAPLAVGSVAGAGVYYLNKFAAPHLPEQVEPFSFALVGMAGAAVTLMVPVGDVKARRLVAAGMATVGAGIDVYRHFFAQQATAEVSAALSTDEIIMDEEADLGGYGAYSFQGGALNNPSYLQHHGYGALALKQNSGYGAWDYTGGALNGYGSAHDYGDEGAEEYNDANEVDAQACPGDFEADEAQTLQQGSRAWFARFGKPGKRMYNRSQKGTYSRHAGKRGHRFGWLIKLVGFKGARHIARLPAHERKMMIAKLKSQAIATLQAHAQSQNTVPSLPAVYEGSGPSGAHGYGATGGYGAFAYMGRDL